jgi:DNA-binding PadR family transcriptional regulator
MLNSLITSHTRIRLLLKFFMDGSTKAHLRGLGSEFGESTNGIRVELNRLEKAGLLVSSRSGNKKIYQANPGHPMFEDIHNMIVKESLEGKIKDKSNR